MPAPQDNELRSTHSPQCRGSAKPNRNSKQNGEGTSVHRIQSSKPGLGSTCSAPAILNNPGETPSMGNDSGFLVAVRVHGLLMVSTCLRRCPQWTSPSQSPCSGTCRVPRTQIILMGIYQSAPGQSRQQEGEHRRLYRGWCFRGDKVFCLKLPRKFLKKQNMNLDVLDSRWVLYPQAALPLVQLLMWTLNRASERREKRNLIQRGQCPYLPPPKFGGVGLCCFIIF